MLSHSDTMAMTNDHLSMVLTKRQAVGGSARLATHAAVAHAAEKAHSLRLCM